MQDIEFIKSIKTKSIPLADAIVQEFTNLVKENERLFVYKSEENIYEELSDQDLECFLYEFFKSHQIEDCWKMARLSEIKKAIKANNNILKVKMDSYDNLINLKNGVLNLDTMELLPHSHEHYFTSVVDVNYDKEAQNAPNFSNFIFTCFTEDDGKTDVATATNICRIGGYLLYPQNKLHKMFLFLGEGANGKSLLIDVFASFFAKKNISHLTLEDLSSDSFTRSRLLNSRLNISTEAKNSKMDAEEIKKIISGEGITINQKFKEPINFYPKTKNIVASNTKPYFNDASFGIYRRIFIVEFKNRFVNQNNYEKETNPETKRIFLAKDYDQMLKEFDEEKSSILNMFLFSLIDLRNNNWQLKETTNSEEVMQEYNESSDTIGNYLKDNYEVSDNEFNLVTPQEILEKYRYWYSQNVSDRPLNYSTISLGVKIKELFRIKSSLMYKNGKKTRSYQLKEKTYDDQALPGMGEILG